MDESREKLLLENRSKELKKFFKDIDKNKDNSLSIEELRKYLNEKSGKNFNNELLVEIFRAIDRDQNSMINFEEFISGYSKAEALILSKIDIMKFQISSSTKNLSEAKRQLFESKARKSENVLTVKIISASGLKSPGISGLKAPVVSITCEGQEIITNPADPIELEWNESFSFHIMRGDGEILVQVFDTDRSKRSNPIGRIAIPLSVLEDQQSHREVFELRTEILPERAAGKITMELNWIYDLPKFLEGLIQEYEVAIKEDKEELDLMEIYLKELQLPINRTSSGVISTQFDNQIADKIDQIYNNTIGENFHWKTLTEILIYSYLGISAISALMRPDFFNVRTIQVLIATAAFLHFALPEKQCISSKIIFYSLLISQLYDICWLAIYIKVISI